MYIVVILYSLGNHDKGKSVYMFSTDATIPGLTTYTRQQQRNLFSPEYLQSGAVLSGEAEPVGTEGQLWIMRYKTSASTQLTDSSYI